jgi:hypothetical protein
MTSLNKLESKRINKNLGDFYIECPWCNEIVYIEKVKCCVFLHAFNTKTQKPIGPHTPRKKIEQVRAENTLDGCGGRFKLVIINKTITPQISDI